MPRTLTFVVTLDEGVTAEGAEAIKNEIIEQINEDQDVSSVHVLPEQLRLNFAKE